MRGITVAVILILLKLSCCCIPTQNLEDLTTSTTTTTTLPHLSCLSGWTLFNRQTYSWCMKMFYGATFSNYGLQDCQTLNSTAVPSGFQNLDEISTMMSIATSVDGNGVRFVFGARRRPECYYSSCNSSYAFYWTDGYTTGTTFVWMPTQPDNGAAFTLGPQTYAAIYDYGEMDDIFPTLPLSGVVCGMLAEHY